MQDFRRLRVWHAARALALEVLNALPDRHARRVPGLRAQAIRAATSVPANIAEGCGRLSRSDFLHFVEIAGASLNELEAHLMLARDARVIMPRDHDHCTQSILATRKMLLALQRSVQHSLALEEAQRRRAAGRD